MPHALHPSPPPYVPPRPSGDAPNHAQQAFAPAPAPILCPRTRLTVRPKSDKCFALLRYRRVGIQLVHRLKISPDIGRGPAEIVPQGVC